MNPDKNKGFLRNTGLDPLKNHKPAFHVGSSSARQQNAIKLMAFRWRAYDSQLIVVY